MTNNTNENQAENNISDKQSATYTIIFLLVVLTAVGIFLWIYYEQNRTVEYYYSNKQLRQIFTLENGKKNGLEKFYFENGQTRLIIPYKDDIENGTAREYYQNGKLKAEVNFLLGKRTYGKWYYENGNLHFDISYKDGFEHGISKEYFENGKKKVIQDYVYGIAHGEGYKYDEKGNVIEHSISIFDAPRSTCYPDWNPISQGLQIRTNFCNARISEKNNQDYNKSPKENNDIILGIFGIAFIVILYFLMKKSEQQKEKDRIKKAEEKAKRRKIMDGMNDKCKFYAKKRKKSEVITLYKELNSIIDNLDQELSEIRDLSRNLRKYAANIIKSTLGMPENLLLGGFAIKRFNRDDSDFDYVKNLTLKEIRGRESNITKLKEIYNQTIVTVNILDEERQDFEELKFYVNEKMMEYLEAVCYRIQVNTQTFDKTNDSKGFYALNVSRVIECEPELNTDKLYNVQSTQIKQFGTKARVNVIINGAYKIPACVFYTYKIFDQGSNIFEGIGNSASYGGNLRA